MISPVRFRSHAMALAIVLAAMCSVSQADVLEIFTETIDQDNVFTANVDLGDGMNLTGSKSLTPRTVPSVRATPCE